MDDIDDAIAAVTLGMAIIVAVFVAALFAFTMLMPALPAPPLQN